MARSVAVVAHTHWDREWYRSFDSFRLRLVAVMESVLSILESDTSFRQFLLDGQMALVDDYLAARPERAEAIERFAREGRLAVGPWYVLMDEFCVSAETIVRNLQLGLSKAESFGGAQRVGYLPDMFGHAAQMPQILRQAGMQHAVVWRGVPSAVTTTRFRWESPDGSSVLAEYLPKGYANGAFLPEAGGALVRRMQCHELEISAFLGDGSPLLLMNGGDHHFPQRSMPTVLGDANSAQADYSFHQTSLAQHVQRREDGPTPTWRGEMRSGARSNVLMGVLSNRVDVKAAAARAERELEKLAEPLAALWLTPGQWPERELDDAWLQVVRNSAHDSICACSADEVGRAVLHRYDAASAIAAGVTRRALRMAEVATSAPGPLVVNPSAFERDAVVELTLEGEGSTEGTQVLKATAAALEERTGRGADIGRILGELERDGWLPMGGYASGLRLEVTAGELVVTFIDDAAALPAADLGSAIAALWAEAGARATLPLRVRVERSPSRSVAAVARAVPGFGWRVWEPAPVRHPVLCEEASMGNGLLRVDVDERTGTFALDDVPGYGKLVDEGDAGDTYNYSPPEQDHVVDCPDWTRVELLQAGPVLGCIRVTAGYTWPARLEGEERVGAVPVTVTTDLELRAGERALRVTTAFDNPCRDHRLRVHLPTRVERTSTVVAECAFASVARDAAAVEGGDHEKALGTFPSRRFVRAGALTVTHEGLLEHELVDGGSAIALTLLRATGVLSRPAPRYRPNAAGPTMPLEDTQLPGPRLARYALALDVADPWAFADETWVPLPVVRSAGTGRLASFGSRLRVEGGAKVSALHRSGGRVELRVFNPSERSVEVRIEPHSGSLVDLRGHEVGRWRGSFALGPWAFATAWLDAKSLDP